MKNLVTLAFCVLLVAQSNADTPVSNEWMDNFEKQNKYMLEINIEAKKCFEKVKNKKEAIMCAKMMDRMSHEKLGTPKSSEMENQMKEQEWSSGKQQEFLSSFEQDISHRKHIAQCAKTVTTAEALEECTAKYDAYNKDRF